MMLGKTPVRHVGVNPFNPPDLHSYLKVTRNAGTSKYGYFLRAETMHGFFTYLEDNPCSPSPAACPCWAC